MSHSLQHSYKSKLFYAIDQLPPIYQSSFKEAIKPHKAINEVFVPKSTSNAKPIIKNNEDEEGYFRNRIIKFNEHFNSEMNILSQLKSDSDKFSRQYVLVNKSSRESLNSKKDDSYLDYLYEVYKKNGYKEDEILVNENVFKPSLMIDPDTKYNSILCLMSSDDYYSDGKFMKKLNKFIHLNNGGLASNRMMTMLDEPLRRGSTKKIEFKSYKEMQRESNLLKREIKRAKRNLREFERSNQTFSWEGRKKSINEKEEEANDNSKKKILDDVFLSSKGMIRSAKPKQKRDDQDEAPSQRRRNKRIRKVELSEEISKTEEQRQKSELEKIYKKTSGGDYIKHEKDLRKYQSKYGKKKLEPIK